MALITCPDCGTEVSDRAKACIKCGGPLHVDTRPAPVVTTQQTGKEYKAAQLIGAVLMCLGVVSCVAKEPAIAASSGMIGLVVYLGARIGAWWNHG